MGGNIEAIFLYISYGQLWAAMGSYGDIKHPLTAIGSYGQIWAAMGSYGDIYHHLAAIGNYEQIWALRSYSTILAIWIDMNS